MPKSTAKKTQQASSLAAPCSPAFVVEAMVVNIKERRCGWKEIARYEDRETAERVRKMNRGRGQFRVREEKPENDQALRRGARKE